MLTSLRAGVYAIILTISATTIANSAPYKVVAVYEDSPEVMCYAIKDSKQSICYKIEEPEEKPEVAPSATSEQPKSEDITDGVLQWQDLVKKYFPEDQWTNALRVMSGENGSGEPTRTHKNGNGSTDYGLFQINSVHRARVGGDLNALLDAEINTRIASEIWHEQGWSPWVAARKLNIK